MNTVGGDGLTVAFLKFSRDDEYEADRAGALMMSAAGWYSAFARAVATKDGYSNGHNYQFSCSIGICPKRRKKGSGNERCIPN